MTQNLPSLEEFLAAPSEQVAQVAPASMLYWVGGSRRSAALAGKATREYASWTIKKLIQAVDLIFSHGVQHIFMPVLSSKNFAEDTPGYRENLWYWLTQVLAGTKTAAHIQGQGRRVRFLYEEHIPQLQTANERLRTAEPLSKDTPALWIIAVPEEGLPLRWMLDKLSKSQAETPEQAIQALYGEDIPPASLCLGFGKLVLSPYVIPPFLLGVLNCYWSQRPGWDGLTQDLLRTVFYDYAYLRPTWQKDKTGRAEKAIKHRTAWEKGPVIGLGTRLGPFWYPVLGPDPTILEAVSLPNQSDHQNQE